LRFVEDAEGGSFTLPPSVFSSLATEQTSYVTITEVTPR